MTHSLETYHKILPRGPAADLEFELQTISAKYTFSPKIHEIFHTSTETIVCMDRVKGDILADIYGENPQDIPKDIWIKIHKILATLFDFEGIEYIDITPYNIMQIPDGSLQLIDFGDAYYTEPNRSDINRPQNWFLKDFLDGEYTWNPDFK